MSRAEDMRHILNQVQNVTVNERLEAFIVALIDDKGNEVDVSEPYSGTSYMMMTAEKMLIRLKRGWKIEIRSV